MDLVEHQRTLYTSSNPTRRWLHVSRRDYIMSAIRRHAPQKRDRAIEVGPGSGVYLPLLIELFDEVTASDIETQYLEAARLLTSQHPSLSLQQCDITDYENLNPNEYDLVLCTEVLEHIPPEKSDAAFRGLRRIMRDDGLLILSTPHKWSTLETVARVALSSALLPLTRIIYKEPVLKLGHINLMTRGQVERSLSSAGFEIVERNASGVYLPIIAETMGHTALQLERWLESRLRGSLLHQLLWTQFYVARVNNKVPA